MAKVTILGSSNVGGGDTKAITGAKTGKNFDPARDMPPLTGKVILITGGASGLGHQAAVEFARKQPRRIYIADLPRDDETQQAIAEKIRSEAGGDVAKDVEIVFLGLDLGSFEAIRAAAREVMSKEGEEGGRLDILVLNAGIMRVKPGMTRDGYEVAFGINYLGHALFVREVMPLLLRTAEGGAGGATGIAEGGGEEEKTADVRIVVVSSEGHVMAPKGGIVFDKLKSECLDMVRLVPPFPQLYMVFSLTSSSEIHGPLWSEQSGNHLSRQGARGGLPTADHRRCAPGPHQHELGGRS